MAERSCVTLMYEQIRTLTVRHCRSAAANRAISFRRKRRSVGHANAQVAAATNYTNSRLELFPEKERAVYASGSFSHVQKPRFLANVRVPEPGNRALDPR